MRVSGKVHIHLELTDFPVPDDAIDAIRADIGEKSPVRILSEYIYRLLDKAGLKDSAVQVSAIPDKWTED